MGCPEKRVGECQCPVERAFGGSGIRKGSGPFYEKNGEVPIPDFSGGKSAREHRGEEASKTGRLSPSRRDPSVPGLPGARAGRPEGRPIAGWGNLGPGGSGRVRSGIFRKPKKKIFSGKSL